MHMICALLCVTVLADFAHFFHQDTLLPPTEAAIAGNCNIEHYNKNSLKPQYTHVDFGLDKTNAIPEKKVLINETPEEELQGFYSWFA